MQRVLLTLSLLLCTFSSASAIQLPIPRDFQAVDIYLVTVPRGEAVFARFGHNVLRVHDKLTMTELNFNWGVFDFEQPGFATKFYTGKLRYMMEVQSSESLIDHYKNYEKRRMEEEKLNLTTLQKQRLYEMLIENAKPQNIHYNYHYFYDNCSTRIRNYLDQALGGVLSPRFKERMNTYGFRKHIRANSLGVWYAYIGLDLLANKMLDSPISHWDEMFLPVELQRILRDAPAFDDNGRPILGTKLLSHHKVLLDLPVPEGGTNPYMVSAALFSALFILGLAGIAFIQTHRIMGLFFLVWGTAMALIGTVMSLNWAVSVHKELHANAGLFLFWPTDWIFVGLGVKLLGANAPHKSFFGKMLSFYVVAHIIAFAALSALYFAGIIEQNIKDQLIYYGLPALAGFLYWINSGWLGTQNERSKRTLETI